MLPAEYTHFGKARACVAGARELEAVADPPLRDAKHPSSHPETRGGSAEGGSFSYIIIICWVRDAICSSCRADTQIIIVISAARCDSCTFCVCDQIAQNGLPEIIIKTTCFNLFVYYNCCSLRNF